MDRGLLVVPMFNQQLELGAVLKTLHQYFPIEDILIVDDGSNDGSAELSESLGYSVLRHGTNRGIGAAIRSGIRFGQRSGYDFVCIFSGNGKMKASQISRVMAPIQMGNAGYVAGSRFCQGGESVDLPLFRHLLIKAFSIVCSALSGVPTTDITCGFRAFRLSLLSDPRIDLDQEWLNRYEMEYYLHLCLCKLTRVVEVPVTIDYGHLQPGRRSKIVPVIDWWRIVKPFLVLRFGRFSW